MEFKFSKIKSSKSEIQIHQTSRLWGTKAIQADPSKPRCFCFFASFCTHAICGFAVMLSRQLSWWLELVCCFLLSNQCDWSEI